MSQVTPELSSTIYFAFCAECPFHLLHDRTWSNVEDCEAKCSDSGLQLGIIESKYQYDCAAVLIRSSTLAWTGMTVRDNILWDKYNGRELTNFAPRKGKGPGGMLNQHVHNVWPKHDRAVYLDKDQYISPPFDYAAKNLTHCLCQPGGYPFLILAFLLFEFPKLIKNLCERERDRKGEFGYKISHLLSHLKKNLNLVILLQETCQH